MPVTVCQRAAGDKRASGRGSGETGFTMIIALGVMFVTSLLLVAAFAIAKGDTHQSRRDTAQKQAYYAALAGVQEYEYRLQSNPNYWASCEEPASTVPGEAGERYEVKLLVASSAPKGTTKCETANPFASMVESKGAVANTMRIESIGCAGVANLTSCAGQPASTVATRSIVATFRGVNFLNYVYYTNFETEDPGLYANPIGCEGAYYKEWSAKGLKCATIVFTSGDSVEGPMHTNDAARVEGTAEFGRPGHEPRDAVEINGGTYPSAACSGGPTYNTKSGCYEKGPTLTPPESDASLRAYAEPEGTFTGVTRLVLNGSTISVTNEGKTKSIAWPKSGLIFVQGNPEKACNYTYESENSDNTEEEKNETNCGNVYVEGNYAKSLTIAGENDVIINGNTYPTGVTLGSAPTGLSVLGLIASHYVRIYHPCSGSNGKGSLSNPWIYAGILSTSHSFVVDNHGCGAALGELHVDGAIAQDYRGIVGQVGGSGYIKDYKYDERLATLTPPHFLSPIKAGWKIGRETSPSAG